LPFRFVGHLGLLWFPRSDDPGGAIPDYPTMGPFDQMLFRNTWVATDAYRDAGAGPGGGGPVVPRLYYYTSPQPAPADLPSRGGPAPHQSLNLKYAGSDERAPFAAQLGGAEGRAEGAAAPTRGTIPVGERPPMRFFRYLLNGGRLLLTRRARARIVSNMSRWRKLLGTRRERFRAADLVLVAPAGRRRSKLQVGSRVRLSSGGPVVTVVDVREDERVTISWRGGSGLVYETDLPEVCLQLVGT